MQYPIAINIAFIPEKEVEEQCLLISKKLADEQDSPYQLGKDGQPHLTLLQGVVASPQQLAEVKKKLEALVAEKPFPTLLTEGFWRSGNRQSLWWKIKIEEVLVQWHDAVIAAIEPLLWKGAPAHAAMFANSTQVRKSDCEWVDDYLAKASGKHFMPHFTLGYGDSPEGEQIPESCEVGYLGLFQLGPYCSCYSKLAAWTA